jgi:hypothetical protein
MAESKLASLVVGAEDLFNDYTITRIMEKSQFFRSGIIVPSQALVPEKGKFMHFPMFHEMDGADEVLKDNASLTVNALTTEDQIAAVLGRGKAFGVNDLVKFVSGTDPLRAMANYVGDYWVRRYDNALISVVNGTSAALDAAHGAGTIINDISGAAGAASNIDAAASYDTIGLLGEFAMDVTHVVMNSAVHTYLNKGDLIDIDFPVSASRPVKTYLGKEVIIDDNITAAGGVYHTYFCRPAALGFADGTAPEVSVEFDRNILSGSNEMTTRRRFVIHPSGVALNVSGAEGIEVSTNALGYSNATLANAGAWQIPSANTDAKKFGIRVLLHKIDQA